MIISDSVLRGSERTIFALRELYQNAGYAPYRMSKFEEYDFYARNKDFLVSDHVITFTDTNGRLMALKPDVTLSIIKNSRDVPGQVQRLYYSENVYRVSRGSNSFTEIMQTGLECFGAVDESDLLQVLELAGRSLKLFTSHWVLALSDLTLIERAVQALRLSAEDTARIYKAIGEKNLHEIDDICAGSGAAADSTAALKALLSVRGGAEEVLPRIRQLCSGDDEAERFCVILEKLAMTDIGGSVAVDFSVTDDTNYYNGIVFKGFISGISAAVLSGGQYDKLMTKMQRTSRAVGFAVYTDMLERTGNDGEDDGSYINIALPKGRLGEQVYDMLVKAGCECPGMKDNTRKLIFENEEKKLRYFWVKPTDVGIYVERGAADIGIEGKDTLLEHQPDIYELLDLHIGRCRMAVAAPKGYEDDASRTLRVATKYPNIAQTYYRSIGRDIDIIQLNGSIEIAPIIGLSDVIVDIVETGTTLRENNLEVVETVVPISARVIANKSSFRFKGEHIETIVRSLAEQTEEKK